MTEPASEKASPPDNKWWEFYFVRYFVGTVVGGAILLYLNASKGTSLYGLIMPGVTDASGLDAQKLALLAAVGLAFCYIASAPVLVVHATRAVFLTDLAKSYRTAALIVLALTGVSATAAVYKLPGFRMPIMVGAMFALVVSMQVVLLVFSLLKRGDCLHSYYLRLVRARSQDSGPVRQYVESYKHLREHGNAFFILLFEVVLGIVLTAAPTPNVAVIALLVWIMPAALVWVIGTLLEYRFSTTAPPL